MAGPKTPRDLAARMSRTRLHIGDRIHIGDGFVRQTYIAPREEARDIARDFLCRYPKQAYMSEVESWRELPDATIEFTMKRLRSAD